ncbi:MAG TPA: cell division protein ZapE [Stellaceae bacterium]|nr:cell division protein ZapE [Stellaceae bacterium]
MRLFPEWTTAVAADAGPASAPATPLAVYRARRAAGDLKPDPMQELAVEKLQILHRVLQGYRPPATERGWRARLGLVSGVRPPQGLYMFGGVGRGKSMLMDLFFATSTVGAKRRVHFHAFMQEVHDAIHILNAEAAGEPIQLLARDIAARTTLLCFDEFQVTNIADAMILGRLFEALFAAGVVVVATSNRAPDELYKDGLQRERFLPFIALLKQHLDVFELENGRDYRRARLLGRPVYYSPDDAAAAASLAQTFAELTDDAPGEKATLTVKARQVPVPRQAKGVAWFSFDGLCRQPLGPADYLALAATYDTILISGLPIMGPEDRNAAQRFNTLIDTLYEAKVRLVVSAAAPADRLYPEGDGSFEFQRTVSRLLEMQSIEYLNTARSA